MHSSNEYSIMHILQVLKIAILSEKYATDFSWYVDMILKLIRHAGDYVSEEVWYRIIQIVINREDVQGYAAKTCFEVRINASMVASCAAYEVYVVRYASMHAYY